MKIAILEDCPERRSAMRDVLADRFAQFEAIFFDESTAMLDWLRHDLDKTILISLDNDLPLKPDPDNGRCRDCGSGEQVSEYLSRRTPVCPVILHTTNASAAQRMQEQLQDAGWKVSRVVPFDDAAWISRDWFRAVRHGLVSNARPLTPSSPPPAPSGRP